MELTICRPLGNRELVAPVVAIRRAERRIINAEPFRDATMQSASRAVAEGVMWLQSLTDRPKHALIIAGSGGNGGDGLYAGAALRLEGWRVTALTIEDHSHDRATEAFTAAGGRLYTLEKFLADADCSLTDIVKETIIVDAIAGLGAGRSLSEEAQQVFSAAERYGTPILAVDVPTGIAADTGRVAERFVSADVTVTFGCALPVHLRSIHCGIVLLADCGLHVACAKEAGKRDLQMGGWRATYPVELVARAGFALPSLTSKPAATDTAANTDPQAHPSGHQPALPLTRDRWEPAATDDKYSPGVVGIRAGSDHYPGAAVLTCSAAVATSASMVRYVGPNRKEVIAARPEVVTVETLETTGKVQAWVCGPGAGIGQAASDLTELVATDLPLLIDADALTALSQLEDLQDEVRKRTAPTLLTPHFGEANRLIEAIPATTFTQNDVSNAADDPVSAARYLARELKCTVLLKGRCTVITDGDQLQLVDAGSSWAATPGSGDVLAGMLGAAMASTPTFIAQLGLGWSEASWVELIAAVVCLHSRAAQHSATHMINIDPTRSVPGTAPTSASRIADAIPAAMAAAMRRP